MSELIDLWLPILVASVALFIASSVLWTVMPHHKPDWNKPPNEDEILRYVRENNVKPGQYMFPYCEPSDFKDPEIKKRYETGPHGIMTVWPGMASMGRNMACTFLFFVVASIFVGYVASVALDPGAEYLSVFRIVGTIGVMAFCMAYIPNAIWFGKPTRALMMDIVDGVIYALIAAGIFASMWPGAPGTP